MISIYIDEQKILKDTIIIDNKNDINHIVNVYRLNLEDIIRVVDGKYEYICSIISIEKKKIIVKINERKEDIYSHKVNVDIALGLLKNDAMSLVIQKLTEIGINNIIPMITDYTVVKVKEKKDKWDTIITEAMKQCRAVKKTNILDIIKLKEIDFEKYDKCIFAYEKAENTKKISEILNGNEKNVLFLIGPEGGFSNEEVEFLINKTEIISLGKRILRAETAAIYVASIIINTY